MLQFTAAELSELREKSKIHTWIFPLLEKEIAPVREHYRIQTTGLGTWRPFFACPDDSVPLIFNIENSESHQCPVCGKYFSGEPYYGAWWAQMNALTSGACKSAAFLYLLTDDEDAFAFAKRILLDYARYYPDYEVHGNIPYNNPGRANAQTLTDSQWIKPLLCAYDFIRDRLTAQERLDIESRFLSPAADFFMEYRADQLHNHELMVGSAIAILGLLLDRKDCLDFALDSKYGIHYQLDHGLLADGFWFEGTTSYHFAAMEQIVHFDWFARHTPYTFLHDARLIKAFKFPIHMVMPDSTLPRLNDIGANYQGFEGHENVFELLYAANPCDEFAYYLSRCYAEKPRENYYAFVYGADYAGRGTPVFSDYHNEDGSGISTLYGPEQRFLLFKHTPYGGEHDHYDRLGLHFMGLGKMAAPDIGTCYYGAPMHYAYYKNTASHNTVCLNGRNQPPANCRVLRYEKGKDCTLIDAEAAWDGSYKPVDSFVIEQWDSEAYRGARFRRVIEWHGDFFIDVFDVEAPNAKTIDWVLHLRGTPIGNIPAGGEPFAAEGPCSFLTRRGEYPASSGETRALAWDLGGGVRFTLHTNAAYLLCDGPDNPSTNRLSYIIQRTEGQKARYVNVFECAREGAPVLQNVRIENGDSVRVQALRTDGRSVDFELNLSGGR